MPFKINRLCHRFTGWPTSLYYLPGPGETWGLAVNEAMACSRAVLVSDKCGCYPDLIQDNINGFVFKSDDSE